MYRNPSLKKIGYIDSALVFHPTPLPNFRI